MAAELPPPPPLASIAYASPAGYSGEAIWREGKQVVASMGPDRSVHLPDRCVKCNADANGQAWKKTLYWHPAGLYVLIFFPGLLIYAIVALAVRKKVVVEAGLCQIRRAQRRNRILGAWGIFLASIGAVAAAIFFGNDPSFSHGPLGAICTVLAIVLFIGSLVFGLIASRVLGVRRIKENTVWFGGACPAYLGTLNGN